MLITSPTEFSGIPGIVVEWKSSFTEDRLIIILVYRSYRITVRDLMKKSEKEHQNFQITISISVKPEMTIPVPTGIRKIFVTLYIWVYYSGFRVCKPLCLWYFCFSLLYHKPITSVENENHSCDNSPFLTKSRLPIVFTTTPLKFTFPLPPSKNKTARLGKLLSVYIAADAIPCPRQTFRPGRVPETHPFQCVCVCVCVCNHYLAP